MFEFEAPFAFLFLLLIPPYVFYYVTYKRAQEGAIRYPTVRAVRALPKRASFYLRHIPFALRLCVIALLTIAIARPRIGVGGTEITDEGILINLVLDNSYSMIMEDFPPTRSAAAKRALDDFIKGRPHDRIGLVVFSTDAYVHCPLTMDHRMAREFLSRVEVDTNGRTAIGLGVATALDGLRGHENVGKAIILLTDGANNAGEIDPQTAAQMAKTFGVKVYVVGLGAPGTHSAPVTVIGEDGKRTRAMQSFTFDDSGLKNIAETTGGAYFNAKNVNALKAIYRDIDELERIEMKERMYLEYRELFFAFAFAAFVLLVLEMALSCTVFRKIP